MVAMEEHEAIWSSLFEAIVTKPGCTVLLGASDTGKSTLARYLCTRSLKVGFKTALIDADPGQSTIGPPTTLGLRLLWLRDTKDDDGDLLYFIGSTTPADNPLAAAVGTWRLWRRARELGAEQVVVDTSGLVTGIQGFQLKFHKISLLEPQHLIAIQRAGDLEEILSPFRGNGRVQIYTIPPHPAVAIRSPLLRQGYRQQRFQAYFRGGKTLEIPCERIAFIGEDPHEIGLEDMLVGLNDADFFTVGLGILARGERRAGVRVFTPIVDPTPVRYLVPSRMSLKV